MAWLRAMGGGSSEKTYLYKDGVWTVGYDNPGSYTFGSNPVSGFTLDVSSFIGDTSHYNVIGTTSKIDVTGKTTLHFKAKSITFFGDNCGFGCYWSTKAIPTSTYTNRTLFGSSTSFVDYALDITGQSEIYIAAFSSANRACEVSEIYLE